MTIRRKHFLLRLTEGTLMLAAAGVCALTRWPASNSPATPDVRSTTTEAAVEQSVETQKPLATNETLWKRPLRRPIFDPPPPPPPQVVKKELPPLRAKLLGTILEPGNSQAMISLPSGGVEFRTVGQPLGAQDNEATIVEITSASVKVKRGEELTTLTVEGTGQ